MGPTSYHTGWCSTAHRPGLIQHLHCFVSPFFWTPPGVKHALQLQQLVQYSTCKLHADMTVSLPETTSQTASAGSLPLSQSGLVVLRVCYINNTCYDRRNSTSVNMRSCIAQFITSTCASLPLATTITIAVSSHGHSCIISSQPQPMSPIPPEQPYQLTDLSSNTNITTNIPHYFPHMERLYSA
jgi:hypothetical protein